MSRFKSNLYTVERRVWRNHKLCWIQNDDFTLFSGHHKTKIKEEDLPEWYVFGRYCSRAFGGCIVGVFP